MRLEEIVRPSVYEDALLNKLIKLSKEIGTENIYVTFTKLDKFAINTNTVYNTPIGLYAYPFSYVLRQRVENVPFASHAPYVWVFKADVPVEDAWIIKVDNPDIRNRVITSVKEITGKDIDTDITDNKKLWRSMYSVIKTMAKPNYHSLSTTQGVSEQAILSHKILKNAGIRAVIDYGTGTIHSNEKNQAVFFNIEDLSVIQKFKNNLAKDIEHEKKLAVGNASVPFEKRLKVAIDKEQRDTSLENLPIPKSIRPVDLADYIANTGKNPWPAAEERIAKDSLSSYTYARNVVGGRWKPGEPAIIKSPKDATWYSVQILKQRWPAAEKVIMSDPYYAIYYAQYIFKQRWPEAEPYIMKNRVAWKKYKDTFGL